MGYNILTVGYSVDVEGNPTGEEQKDFESKKTADESSGDAGEPLKVLSDIGGIISVTFSSLKAGRYLTERLVRPTFLSANLPIAFKGEIQKQLDNGEVFLYGNQELESVYRVLCLHWAKVGKPLPPDWSRKIKFCPVPDEEINYLLDLNLDDSESSEQKMNNVLRYMRMTGVACKELMSQ